METVPGAGLCFPIVSRLLESALQAHAQQGYRALLRASPGSYGERDTPGLPSGSLASGWDSWLRWALTPRCLSMKSSWVQLLGGTEGGQGTILGARFLGFHTSKDSPPTPSSLPTKTLETLLSAPRSQTCLGPRAFAWALCGHLQPHSGV